MELYIRDTDGLKTLEYSADTLPKSGNYKLEIIENFNNSFGGNESIKKIYEHKSGGTLLNFEYDNDGTKNVYHG